MIRRIPANRPDIRRAHPRRGSIYIVVLGVAMIVSLMGLVALKVQRIQSRAYEGGFDMVQAQLHSQTALRMGMLRIEQDPDWRYNFPNGMWEQDQVAGSGTYSLIGYDPSDADLTDTPEDPLILVGIGKQGRAVQKMAITICPENRGLSCLETAMHAQGNINVNTAWLPMAGTISANGSISESGPSAVTADVEAVSNINGDDFYGRVQTGVDPREMPGASVFDYYLDHGTPIDISAIVAPPASNLVQNPGFESGSSNWSGTGLAIFTVTSDSRSGTKAGKLTSRLSSTDAITQQISPGLSSGRTYLVELWAKKESLFGGTVNIQPELQISASGSGTTYFSNGYTNVGTSWGKVTTTITPTWSGTLQSVTLRIETSGGTDWFSVDDVVVKETNRPTRMISRQLLSPTSNPFGGSLNALGIYVIDCQGQDLYIEESRIVGTLVLLNNGGNSTIRSAPINWAPAASNHPALLVEESIRIEPTNGGLIESALGVNFNPVGTGYSGLGSDSDVNDTYPSQISGLIYAAGNITFANQPTILGGVVAGQSISINGGTLSLTHTVSLPRSPPPGFSGPEEIKILLGSAKKVID